MTEDELKGLMRYSGDNKPVTQLSLPSNVYAESAYAKNVKDENGKKYLQKGTGILPPGALIA